MKILVAVAVVLLIHGSYATLLIKGPTEPVLEGDPVVLECLISDSDLNISQVHFEFYSKYMRRWYKAYEEPWERSWCYYRMRILRTADSLLLSIRSAGRYFEGPYRCVSDADNVTSPDNSSETLRFKVHYMGELSLSREGYTSYLSVPEELRVRAGDDVVVNCSASSSEEPSYYWQKEGDDWILPSSQLTLRKVSAMNEGQYTCMAQHPSVASLSKKRTISITVLPKDAPWYKTSNGRLVLMTSGAAAAALLVFILFVSILQHRRAKQTKTSKGPIDDRSQKKPIYKASVESLPSTTGDEQPLV
ncbi:carcinoembryonic antigen-related cell adhesion molecule 18 [Sphaeramia orbicularis]|uniref:Carcinoembryonic antigen-related cell adhesion molecule 18-like n=1 Tax=Sphaeramia orbicularis TaxID=375764 RepID=A0A672YER8_9TELE|nr:carcinoembryonic antigen-related cell adhesion molecule 18-like [Sphaeramia orbicularis]